MNLSQRVIEKCTQCGTCLIWKGAWASEGTTPSIHHEGKSVNVRVALWTSMGKRVPKGHTIKASCGERQCVAPEHLVAVNYRKVPRTLAQKRAVTRAARARSVLTPEIVAVIRESAETQTSLAARFGVSLQAVNGIVRNRRWVLAASPFAGLGARP